MESSMNSMVSLNGRNYHIWKGKMEDLLYVKHWHLPVFGGIKSDNMTDVDILNEDMRRKSQASSSYSEVLVIERRGRSQTRGPRDRSKSRSKSRSSWKKKVKYHHCGKLEALFSVEIRA
ncbi:hypothetical protein CFOL_v3_20205 [Cephalotus follicularis]|uniref:Uncharacterized protein n=1 Tax=Cephalotus follicularis TaxID=3775 RepID=A0A1Q3C9E2_CEPFO|nr:hypothetical protein CFOL_v3_20205 [Cephalotus follicularis]